MTHKRSSLVILISIVVLGSTLHGCGAHKASVLAANEVSAIVRLQMIYKYEQIKYTQTHKYVPLDQLFSEEDESLSPIKSNPGYRFELSVKQDGNSFQVVATPADYNKTGRRSFFMNEQGVIHGADKAGGEANLSDPELARADR